MKAKKAKVVPELIFKFEFYDEHKFRKMPISEVNDWIRKEKRRFRLRNEEGVVVMKKTFKG